MSRVFGETHFNGTAQKYYYQIETDTGQLLARSNPMFASMADAAAELIAVLQDLAKKSEAPANESTRGAHVAMRNGL
jgi:nanoRNase/pAp phosphatase (c-di-AMP/oligoRNAs hydrolase)